MLAPPYSSGTVMPSTPSSPILSPQVHRELVAAVDLGRARRDLGLGERVHGVAQRVDVFTEHEIQAGQVAHLSSPGLARCMGGAVEQWGSRRRRSDARGTPSRRILGLATTVVRPERRF